MSKPGKSAKSAVVRAAKTAKESTTVSFMLDNSFFEELLHYDICSWKFEALFQKDANDH